MLKASADRRLRALGPCAAFLGTYALLNVVANLHYPAEDPPFAYLIPSVDVTILFGIYAWLAARDRAVPRPVHVALVVLFALARVLRIADGIETRYFNRVFNFYIDFPLLPDLFRLLRSTLSTFAFVLAIAAAGAGMAAVVFIIHRSLRASERLLRARANRVLLASIAAVFALLSLVPWREVRPERYAGAFGASAMSRWYEETDFLLHVYGLRASKLAAIESTRRAIDGGPSDLTKLHRANVLIFVVESYGQTVLDRPEIAGRIEPVYAELDQSLRSKGFSIASSLLDSPTYGGRSWLAQATIITGVRTPDQWHYELLRVERPKTISDFFRAAGYRTVLFQPGTTRASPWGDIYRFEKNYFAPAFGYNGPSFGWATMPDEYVLDFVERAELGDRSRPLLAVCALVSSHAPWDEQPAVVGDWKRLGDGSIYSKMDPVRFDVDWTSLEKGTDAYARSIEYDLHAIEKFLVDFVGDDSLVIVLGDHQPAPDITLGSPAHGVPVHVISRDAEFVDSFRKRGYVAGMRPDPGSVRKGMETFLPDLLRDFSVARVEIGADARTPYARPSR